MNVGLCIGNVGFVTITYNLRCFHGESLDSSNEQLIFTVLLKGRHLFLGHTSAHPPLLSPKQLGLQTRV